MIKSRSALRLGGALAIALAVLLLFSACAENSRTPDDTSSATEYTDTGSGSSATDGEAVIDDYSETVEVSISSSSSSAESSDTLAPKALTATSGSYSTASSDKLYWTYTAVKNDSYFSTGQTSSETWVSTSTDDDGNVTVSADLPESLPGKFSVGDWIFTFNAYTSAEMSDDYLFYQGTATSVTLSSGGENTVSVTVELYEAVKDADEDGNTYGTLVVYGITFTNQDGETQTLSDITLWYSIDSGNLTEDSGQAMLASSSGSGLTFDKLEPGSHTFTAYVTDTSGNVLASGSASALVKPNLTTTITGDIEEDESATTSVTLGDLSVSYGSISVSSEDGLTAALTDSEVSTVALSSGITLTSALTISNETALDLAGYTLDLGEYVITLDDGAEVVISDSGSGGTLTTSGTTLFQISGTDASLEIDSGVFSSTSTGVSKAVYIASSSSEESDDESVSVTINGGTFDTFVTFYIASESEVTVNDGTFNNSYGIALYSDDTDLTINGGTFTFSAVGIQCASSSENSTITITDGTFTASNSASCVEIDASANATLNISGGTFTSLGSDYTCVLVYYGAENATVNISGGTFNAEGFALAVNGLLTQSDNATVNISGGEFNNEVYIAGYTTLTISGGTFSGKTQQALHVRAGNMSITGGTFTSGLSSSTAYDYCSYDGDSTALNGDVVIEYCYTGSSGYSAVTAFTISGGEYKNQGICYYIDPASTYTEPEISVSSDYTSAYTAIDPDTLVYKVVVSSSQSAYFTTEDAATSYLESNSGTLYSYDSENGWVSST